MESISLFRIAAAAICIFVLTVAGCTCVQNYQDNTAITEMVKSGADPVRARCAVRGPASGAEAVALCGSHK